MVDYSRFIIDMEYWGNSAPLGVGAEVFVRGRDGKVVRMTVAEIKVNNAGKVVVRLSGNTMYFTALSAFGKSVFFSRDEALVGGN